MLLDSVLENWWLNLLHGNTMIMVPIKRQFGIANAIVEENLFAQ